MEISKQEWKLIFQESIDAIRETVDKDMPLSCIQILLTVPDKGQVSFREIEKQSDLPHSTCSRGLSLLAGLSKLRVNNFEPLVSFRDDLADRRVRYALLTPYGLSKMNAVYDRVATRLSRIKSFTKGE